MKRLQALPNLAGPIAVATIRWQDWMASDDRARVQAADRLIFALDVPSLDRASALVDELREDIAIFKVGLELFTAAGPRAVDRIQARGARVFLDLKLHDIPATVQRSVQAAVQLGVSYLTLHASAGPQTLRAAAEAAAGSDLRLLAVTVLTSSDAETLAAIGVEGGVAATVARLADLAVTCGIQGLVCSPAECSALRAQLGRNVLLVTPGVRPSGESAQDQKRVSTPAAAIAAGADMLVVGRPIRDAAEPRAAARQILQEIARAV
jgi:orotidine-5'-phosphate decarboxylase